MAGQPRRGDRYVALNTAHRNHHFIVEVREGVMSKVEGPKPSTFDDTWPRTPFARERGSGAGLLADEAGSQPADAGG